MASDAFLKIDGIPGESKDSKFKDLIELVGWAWSCQQQGTFAKGGGGGAGKVYMQDLHFSMRANKASPKVMLACASGQHIPKVELICRKAGGKQEEHEAELQAVQGLLEK